MRYTAIITALLLLFAIQAKGQRRTMGKGYYMARVEIVDGDSIQVIDILPVVKFSKGFDQRKHERLINNVKKVYPIAVEAKLLLDKMEKEMLGMSSVREQNTYIRQMEKDLKKQYDPVLRRMTMSQGRILIKLIDRQTSNTSYDLVKELRGNFSAFFWQSVARIFGANLKDSYDKDGEDKIIEQIIILYEAGMI